MGATIEISEDRDINLGPYYVFKESFREMSETCGGFQEFQEAFANLSGIVTQVESNETADPEWLKDVRNDAQRFLSIYQKILTPQCVWVLEQLSKPL